MEKIFPQFEPAMGASGRWFVAVQTGKGPNSHIGDFETESEAERWIATKAKHGLANRIRQNDPTQIHIKSQTSSKLSRRASE
jgi:hypothetical protein